VTESEHDRRRAERIPINDEFARYGGGGPGSTWVSDLSPTGVFVHTDELLPVGVHLELRFTVVLDDPVVLEAVAKVVRHSHKPRGMGVAFVQISPEMTERIAEVLAEHQPLDSGAPLRLPEPSSRRFDRATSSPGFELPRDDDGDDDDVPSRRDHATSSAGFARPAPIEGLDLRRVSEEAVTAAFPQLDEPLDEPLDQDKTRVFKTVEEPLRDDDVDELDSIDVELEDDDDDDEPAPRPSFRRPPPPPPGNSARAHATRDDDRTRVYQAVPLAAGADDDDDPVH
jgi:hypothetical protein